MWLGDETKYTHCFANIKCGTEQKLGANSDSTTKSDVAALQNDDDDETVNLIRVDFVLISANYRE